MLAAADAPDPELAAVLALPSPDVTRLEPTWLREAMRRPLVARQPAHPVASVVDQVVPAPHPVPVRIYVPEGEPPFATVVFLHGSGWVVFDLDSYDFECRALAALSRSVVVSVGYRLAPEHRFPAALVDSLEAVTWAAGAARCFGGSRKRLAVVGDSAGANLAAVVCQRLRDSERQVVHLQALVYPVTDLRGGHPSRKEHATGGYLTTELMQWFERQYVRCDDDRLDPRLSPLLASRFDGLPPALVVTAGFDPLRDEASAYADALDAAGVPVERLHFPTAVHGIFQLGATTRLGRNVLEQTATAIGRALHAGGLAPWLPACDVSERVGPGLLAPRRDLSTGRNP